MTGGALRVSEWLMALQLLVLIGSILLATLATRGESSK